MLGYLLHIANSDPWFRDRFYAMKTRILHRYATADGYDLQELPGKECWSCYGTGVFVHYSGNEDQCWKCDGCGWYRRPRWTKLQRWKLGRYSFHEPAESGYGSAPLELGTPRNLILGYVRHRDYSTRRVLLATFLLGLRYDPQLASLAGQSLVDRLWLVQLSRRRCLRCNRRLWLRRKCGRDPDVPF